MGDDTDDQLQKLTPFNPSRSDGRFSQISHPISTFGYGVAFTCAKIVTSIEFPAPIADENDPPWQM